MDNFMYFPLFMVVALLVICGYGIRCDHQVKMRELDLIEKGIIKKEIRHEK